MDGTGVRLTVSLWRDTEGGLREWANDGGQWTVDSYACALLCTHQNYFPVLGLAAFSARFGHINMPEKAAESWEETRTLFNLYAQRPNCESIWSLHLPVSRDLCKCQPPCIDMSSVARRAQRTFLMHSRDGAISFVSYDRFL